MAEGFAALPGQSSHETCGPPMVIFSVPSCTSGRRFGMVLGRLIQYLLVCASF